MDHKETEYEGLDRVHVTQDRNQWQAFVNTSMNLRTPQKARNFSIS
jgi:hypothetical protein